MFDLRISMKGNFDISKQKVDIKCPKCNMRHNVSLDDIQHEKVIHCSCGTNIELKDKDQSVKKGINDINKSLNDLKRTIEKFGK